MNTVTDSVVVCQEALDMYEYTIIDLGCDKKAKDEIPPKPYYGLVRAAIEAYSGHYGLVITPDSVWISILSQVSLYFSHNSEELRNKYVNFEGKKKLTATESAFQNILECLARKVDENILDKDFLSWTKTKFSTSTGVDDLVKSAIFLGIFQKYFEFCVSECGLKDIEIRGTLEDWEKIYINVDKILSFDYVNNRYNIPKWHQGLKYFISKFVDVKKGNIDKEFWINFVNDYNKMSGGPYVNGNILALCEFYEKKDGSLRQRDGGHIRIEEIPKEYVIINIESELTSDIYEIKAGTLGFGSKSLDKRLVPYSDCETRYIKSWSFISRLETFWNWTHNTDPVELAKAGFIYTGASDITKCPMCNIQLGHWEDDDIPMVEHKKWSKNCKFLN